MDLANSARAAENRTRWKGIVAKWTTFQGYGMGQNRIDLHIHVYTTDIPKSRFDMIRYFNTFPSNEVVRLLRRFLWK